MEMGSVSLESYAQAGNTGQSLRCCRSKSTKRECHIAKVQPFKKNRRQVTVDRYAYHPLQEQVRDGHATDGIAFQIGQLGVQRPAKAQVLFKCEFSTSSFL